MAASGFFPFLSAVLGWVYTICWSASFYPQPLLNWRRKTTSGSIVDFPLINVLGFAAYLVSNAAFLYSPVVRAQYAARHHGLYPAADFNDFVFALHATVICILTTSQYLFTRTLWSFAPNAGNRPSNFILGVAVGCLAGVLLVCAVVAASPKHGSGSKSPAAADPAVDWCDLDIVYAVGYVKLLITLVKYTPQALANYRNKSTAGWSIWQVLLDLAGGILSVGQLIVDSYLQGDWSGVTGNPVKFALGNISVIYDALFITQHYILYRDPGRARGRTGSREDDRLLPDEERRLD